MKKFLIIIILFITGCGYQPIYLNKNLKNFEFSKITTEGDKIVNKKIISFISIKENSQNKSLNELLIKSSYNTIISSKNSKGQAESYKSKVLVTLQIKDKYKIIKSRNFSEEFSYTSKNNNYDLVEYQNDVLNNLTNQVIKNIILYLNIEW